MSFYPSIGQRGFSHQGFISFPELSAFVPGWDVETFDEGKLRMPALARIDDRREHFLFTTYCFDEIGRIGGAFACFIDFDAFTGICKPPSTANMPDGLVRGIYQEREERTWIRAAGIVYHFETGEPMHGFYFDFSAIRTDVGIGDYWLHLHEAVD